VPAQLGAVSASDDLAADPVAARRRRAQVVLRLRLAMLAFVVAYFFLPYEIRAWIPVWLPFLVAVALEAHFFLGGLMEGRGAPGRSSPGDRGPQARDLAELGGEEWRDALAVEHGGRRFLVPTAGLSDEELNERLEAYLEDPEAALAEAEEPWRRPAAAPAVHPRGWHLRRLAEALAVLAVVGGILYWASRPHGWDAVSDTNRARAEALFSREASKIAGHPARIGCDTAGRHVGVVQDADGVAEVGGTQAYLTPSICDTLYQLAFKYRVQSFPRTARAIAVLGHEAWHLNGVADEGIANCYAFQSGVATGVELGLSEERARSMMRQQLATNASDAAADQRYLVPSGCRQGGEHDLHPASDKFP
jgi:hypothetical protein